MAFEPLHSERLEIRRPQLDDVDAVFARRNDPEVAELQAWETPYPRDRVEELVADSAGHDDPPIDQWWMLTVVSEAGIVGDLALRLHWDGRAAEVGYTFDRAKWGKGYASEALHRLIEWLFDEQEVTRVAAQLHPDNIRSARVLERCGFDFEGHTRNSFWVGDENSDDLLYGLTPDRWDEWNQRPTGPPEVLEWVEPDPQKLRALVNLTLHHSQKRFVSPIAVSLAQAGFPPTYDGDAPEVPWPRVIVADGVQVGFVMMAEPSAERPDASLWRLSVDRNHQGRGIGKRTVQMAIEQAKVWGAPGIEVSWVPGVGSPEPLYRACGFEPTGEILDDLEIVGRLGF